MSAVARWPGITVVMEPLTSNIRRGGITMYWKLFSFGGPLLLAGAVALATPASAQAQHHGGEVPRN